VTVSLPIADNFTLSNQASSYIQTRLLQLPGVRSVLVRRVGVFPLSSSRSPFTEQAWFVTFMDPFGDVPELIVQPGTNTSVEVVEIVKGYSPVEGVFMLSYHSSFTKGISCVATPLEMKHALEALPGVGKVRVKRELFKKSLKWWITFTSVAGDLPTLQASANQPETQEVFFFANGTIGGGFFLRYQKWSTSKIDCDADAATVREQLQRIATINVIAVERQNISANGWLITFWDLEGSFSLFEVDQSSLVGENITVQVSRLTPGRLSSLYGQGLVLSVQEEVPGRPSYTSSYSPLSTGEYLLQVSQLYQGGLQGSYFVNTILSAPSVLEVVEPTIDFDWGFGEITHFSRDYVSARWFGKLLSPTSEEYMFYLAVDDAGKLFINHQLVIDGWNDN